MGLRQKILPEVWCFGKQFAARAQKPDTHLTLICCIGEERISVRPLVIRAFLLAIPGGHRYESAIDKPDKLVSNVALWNSVMVGQGSGYHA